MDNSKQTVENLFSLLAPSEVEGWISYLVVVNPYKGLKYSIIQV